LMKNEEVKSLSERYSSELLKMEQKLGYYSSFELFAHLVSQSPNAIMLMDKDANIKWINKGFSDMYEYTFDEFTAALGKNYRQTSFSPDVQHRLDFIEQTKQPYRYEALNVTRTGRSLWTQTALMPILDQNGEITNLVTIDTDIDQRVTKSDNLVSEMEKLNSQIDNLSIQLKGLDNEFRNLFQSIVELYALIDKTNEILQFIKAISDKTKILGFNASIEANRAGESGNGFRVITNEIIDISDQTVASIKEIKLIVDSIQSKQNELINRKLDSENSIKDYHEDFDLLKKEVASIKSAISEFKSLA
jgi:PAS domain S-box-containing protein